MAYFNTLFLYLPGRTHKNHEPSNPVKLNQLQSTYRITELCNNGSKRVFPKQILSIVVKRFPKLPTCVNIPDISTFKHQYSDTSTRHFS